MPDGKHIMRSPSRNILYLWVNFCSSRRFIYISTLLNRSRVVVRHKTCMTDYVIAHSALTAVLFPYPTSHTSVPTVQMFMLYVYEL